VAFSTKKLLQIHCWVCL